MAQTYEMRAARGIGFRVQNFCEKLSGVKMMRIFYREKYDALKNNPLFNRYSVVNVLYIAFAGDVAELTGIYLWKTDEIKTV